MNISLDYDDTYTKDPEFWNNFIIQCQTRDHTVYCVTLRNAVEKLELLDSIGKLIPEENIIFCNYKSKYKVCQSKNITIDVWIDDMPWFVGMDFKFGVNFK